MKKLNILIIEDETIISMHIKNSIVRMGHNIVDIVKNSTDALKLAENQPIDIALVDININGSIDGIQTANILNKLYNMPIVFITAYKDMGTLERASVVEFVGYIIKPFRDDELEAIVNLAIIKYELNKDEKILKIDDNYSYNLNENKIYKNDIDISLTQKENKLLQLIINAKGSIITYSTIDDIIWYDSSVSDVSRRQVFYRLKHKLPDFPFIVEKNVGYCIKLY
ncbi:MAG: hypothetical protein DRG78_05310 [Epsilonproteobacteria bacterium]|nr:MAG: hypothetical protein DRG78_05310 [Campylobacterota bacterium]